MIRKKLWTCQECRMGRPRQQMAAISQAGEDDCKWHRKVELRTAVTYGKQRNSKEHPP